MAKKNSWSPSGHTPGSHNRDFASHATPKDLVPTEAERLSAQLVILEIIPHDLYPKLTGTDDEQTERIAKVGWRHLAMFRVTELWPYADNVRFPPAERARLLWALAVLDLWVFRPAPVKRPVH